MVEEERFRLQPATREDARLLFEWKNDRLNVQNSLSGKKVSWLQHTCWLEAVLKNRNRHLYLACLAGTPIGQLRLDVEGKEAQISYSIAEEFRNKGFGRKLLLLAEKEALALEIDTLTASVLPHNVPSRKLFSSLGYEKREEKDILYFRKKMERTRGTVYIRTDMNPVIATGHVMRCLSIADAIREQGGEAVFITADEYPLETLKCRGYETMVLNSDWKSMEDELPQLLKLIEAKNVQKLLVDSYQVTEKYLAALEEKTQVIYLDDLDQFPYPVSAIICYANYWKRFSYASHCIKDKSEPALYLGMDYVPLRKVFWHGREKEIREEIKNVLLLSGGTDTYHILEKLVDFFKTRPGIQVNIICGAYYPNFKALCEKYRDCRQLIFHQNVANPEEFMDKADLAVSAGGTTLYELCAMGTPTISYSFVDNQLFNVEQFAKEGIIDYAGDVRHENIYEEIGQLFERYQDHRLRRERSLKMQKQVDGRGAERIARVLLENE